MKGYQFRIPRASKYNNVKTPYNGVLYDSIKEAQYAQTLDVMRRAVKPEEKVVSWERQIPYPIVVKKRKIATYNADFRVLYADRHVEVIDVKSVATRTDVYKLKKKLVECLYGIEIKEII